MMALLLLLFGLWPALAADAPPFQLVVQRGHSKSAPPADMAFRVGPDHLLTISAADAIVWERSTGRELRRTESRSGMQSWRQWYLDLEAMQLIGLASTAERYIYSLPDLELVEVDGRLTQLGPVVFDQLSADGRWAAGLGSRSIALASLEDPEAFYVRGVPAGSHHIMEPAQLLLDAEGQPVIRGELARSGDMRCWRPTVRRSRGCPPVRESGPDDVSWHAPGTEGRPPTLLAPGARPFVEPLPTMAPAAPLIRGISALYTTPSPETIHVVPSGLQDGERSPLIYSYNLRSGEMTTGPVPDEVVKLSSLADEGVLFATGPLFDLRWHLWSGEPGAPIQRLSCLAPDGETDLFSDFTLVRWTARGPLAVVEGDSGPRVLQAERCEALLELDEESSGRSPLSFLAMDPSGDQSYWARSAPPGTCVVPHDGGPTRCVTQPVVPLTANIAPDGRLLETVDTPMGLRLILLDLETGEHLRLPEELRDLTAYAFSPDMRWLAVHDVARVTVVDLQDGGLSALPYQDISALTFSDGGAYLTTAHHDGQLRLWRTGSWTPIGSMMLFPSGGFVLTDLEGRLDREGVPLTGLHYVFQGQDGPESIELAQLERYYYEPRLLAKSIDPALSPRPLVGFDPSQLPPRVSWTLEGERLDVHLQDRGGGYGPVRVSINGREILNDARPPELDPSQPALDFSVDLAPFRAFRSGDDQLSVIAFDAAERVSGRGAASLPPDFFDEAEDAGPPVDVFAVVVGTGEYADPSLSLRYATVDAHAMAQAFAAGGRALLEGSEGELHVQLITTDKDTPNPSREVLEAAFAEVAEQAGAEDLLLVYLAGHGVSRDGQYFYPLPDASASDLQDPALLEARSLTHDAIMELMRGVPANKRVLILDTCESGGVIQGGRSELAEDAQKRAVAELRDRMGLFILAGAPAGRSAYESPLLGHGLLTYTLIDALSGAAPLEDGRFWDISTVMAHAVDAVPELARTLELGDTQAPVASVPGEARSFVFGARPSDPAAMPALRTLTGPPLVGGQLLDRAQGVDHLELSPHLDRALSDIASSPDAGFRRSVETRGGPAWRLGGLYRVDGAEVKVDLRLVSPEGERVSAELIGPADDPERVGACAARWTLRALDAAKGRAEPAPAQVDVDRCGI